jgi:AmmeMemoRadiSam system protein A
MLPLTDSEQQLLLSLARQALEASVRSGRLPAIEKPAGAPESKCGAFVTLHKLGRLRGCVGFIESLKPLYQTVRECAEAAALNDGRFNPVSPSELPLLHLDISVLSPLEDIPPEQVEVGRHGLLISRGFQRGLLLPQVAVEWKWDRETFLTETCHKAGLPADDWRHGARLQAFTAQVFAESSVPAASSHPAR